MNKYSTKHKLSSIWYYHYDGSGNVVALTNATGKVVQTYSYDAYGNLLAKTGSSPNSYMFSTKEYDSKSGLYYFGARYYDPEIGRWMSKDPMGMIDGPNMYLYCLNNPINFMDPFGYCISWIQKYILSPAGKVWNLPNTVIGVAWGLSGLPFGASVGFGNNAIEFYHNPAMSIFTEGGKYGAITLGNTINYGESVAPTTPLKNGSMGNHEQQHTYQGEFLGPFYLPSNSIGGAISEITTKNWHGNNFMEKGPQSNPASSW
ncbi:MAG: RHS repeat-associated core domain-containing protein [Lentisphaerota bacterium]